jgi:hypothetical protein
MFVIDDDDAMRASGAATYDECHDGTVDGGPSSNILRVCLEDRVPPNHLLRRIKVFANMALTLERRGVENVPTGTL